MSTALSPPRTKSALHARRGRKRRNRIHRRRSERLWIDPALVALVVVIAYLPYLVGIVSPGVFGFNSGLATSPLGPWLGAHVGLPWIDPNVGYVSQALGHLAATDLIHGHIPWWNPYEGVGVPLFGEGQSAALFPPTLFLLTANGQILFHLSLQVVAGIATQRLLKTLGMARWVSIVGAILFALNGTFAWLTNAAFNPIAFLPILLLGIEYCRTESVVKSRRGWVLIAVGIALSLYAGFPETAYIDGLMAGVWTLARFVQLPRPSRPRFIKSIGFGTGVGVLVSAPFLVAFFDATRHADIGGHASAFASLKLQPIATNTFGLPYLFGPIFGFSQADPSNVLNGFWGGIGGYLTAAVIVMALYGLFTGLDIGLKVALACWVIVAAARAFGVGPIVDLTNLIPGISTSAFSRYSAPSWEMATVVLAAMGLDSIGRSTKRHSWNKSSLALAGAVTAFLLAIVILPGQSLIRQLDRAPGFSSYPVTSVLWAVSTLLILVFAGTTFRPSVAQTIMGLVLIVDAVAMFMTPQMSAPKKISVDTASVVYLQHHIGLYRFATLGPIVPNYGSYFSISEVNAHDLPLPKRWTDFVKTHLETNELPQQFDGVTVLNHSGPTPLEELITNLRYYEAIGVKYVIAPSTPIPGMPGHIVFRDHQSAIYGLDHPSSFYTVTSGSCRLIDESVSQLTAACSRSSTLVRNELYDAGWSATIGGSKVAISHAGPLFQSVTLPPGTSTVKFTYLPKYMDEAGVLAILGVVAVFVALFAPNRRRKRKALTDKFT